MKNRALMMKILIPILTLFLASCGVHNHRYDAQQDAYYEDDYYAYDNYDPYYGYGSSEYSTAGGGVYYNNYNYYPDRWGVTYSNVNYSPFRYPRVGFYFSSGYNCGFSYWSNCSSGLWGSSYYGSGFYASSYWPSYGFGLGYNHYYNNNYWWYNHWRNRNYDHHRPTQRGYYSARNETGRLMNNRYYSNNKGSSKNNYSQRNNQRNSDNNRSNPRPVNRGRSSSNRPINRSSGNRSSGNRTNRASQPVQRSRQQSAVLNPNGRNYRQVTGKQNARRSVESGGSNSRELQSNSRQNYAERNLPNNRYPKPALVASNISRQRVTQTNRVRQTARTNQKPQQQTNVRVKPMNSQSPVYYSNSRSNTAQQPVQRSNVQRSNVQRSNNHNQVTQSRPQQQTKPQQSAKAPAAKPQRQERSKNQTKKSNESSNRNNKSRERQR